METNELQILELERNKKGLGQKSIEVTAEQRKRYRNNNRQTKLQLTIFFVTKYSKRGVY